MILGAAAATLPVLRNYLEFRPPKARNRGNSASSLNRFFTLREHDFGK